MVKNNSFISKITMCVFFTLAFIYLEALLSSVTERFVFINSNIILFSAVFGIISAIIASLFAPKHNLIIGSIILLLSEILFIIEAMLHRSFGYFYPLATIFGMAYDVLGSYGGTAISTIVDSIGYIILFFVPSIVYLILYLKSNLFKNIKNKFFHFTAIAVCMCIILQFITVSLIERNEDTKYVYGEGYEFGEAAKQFGLLTALRLELLYSSSESNTITTKNDSDKTTESKKETLSKDLSKYNVDHKLDNLNLKNASDKLIALHNYLISQSPTEKNTKSGIFANKNLIFICAEALSPYVISKNFTPTLYKMSSDGYSFTNYYTPSFGESTTGGEYALLLSQVPSRDAGEKGLSMYLAKNNDLCYSLPGYFASIGYITNGYHNNSYTYYHRDETHPNLGMNWYGCGGCKTIDPSAPICNLSDKLTSCWPRSDRELIEATFDSYCSIAKNTNKHFFTYYLTVSGHNNYSFSGNAMSAKNKEYVSTLPYSNTVKAYFAAQKELDLAMEALLSKLTENGLLNDTVIVISNDHYPYGLNPSWAGNNGKDYLSELYGHTADTPTEREKGCLIIYNASISESETITKPTSSFDVLPTVLNLFGVDFDSRIFSGQDIFSERDGFVFFSDGSFITSDVVYNARTKRADFITPIDVSEEDYLKSFKLRIKNIVYHSKQIRKYNYFAYLS